MALMVSKVNLNRLVKHSNYIRIISGVVILVAGIYNVFIINLGL